MKDVPVPDCLPWIKSGELIFKTTMIPGFEALPQALASLYISENHGKTKVELNC